MKRWARAASAWFGWSGSAIGVTVAAGWWPTERLGGAGAIEALVAGCAVGLAGSAVGAVPVLVAVARPAAAKAHVVAGVSMALRAAGTTIGAVVVTLGDRVPRVPFLAWVGLAYGALLLVETRWTLRWLVAGEH